MQRDQRPLSGFSLIELLVVVSILGILAAMLMPMLGKMREQAKRTVCSSGLRQVGMACFSYAGEWEGAFPKQNPNPNFWSRPLWGQGLYGVITYLDGNGKTLFCAGSLSARNSIYTFSKEQILAGDWANVWHFGYNYYAGCVNTLGNWSDQPFNYDAESLGSLGAAMKPNNKNLFSTSKLVSASGHSSMSSALLAGDAIYIFGVGSNWQTTGINHPSGGPLVAGGGGNYVHGDGHVEWYSFPTDIINGGGAWCSYVPWKQEHVNE